MLVEELLKAITDRLELFQNALIDIAFSDPQHGKLINDSNQYVKAP